MRIIIEIDNSDVVVKTADAPRETAHARAQPPAEVREKAAARGAVDAGPAPTAEELRALPAAASLWPVAAGEAFDAGEAPEVETAPKRERR